MVTHMKLSVSTYSFNHYANPEKLGIIGAMDKAKEMGFEAIEISESQYINKDSARLIREHSEKISLPVIAFDVGADFPGKGDDGIKSEVERVCALVDVAKILGAPMMRHDVWYGSYPGHENPTFEEVLPILVESCRTVTEYARERGVKTMVENHGYYVQDSWRVKALVEAVDSDNYGALVDIGNFLCVDEDNISAIRTVAPLAFHAHAKDFHRKLRGENVEGEGWFPTRDGNHLIGAVIGEGVLDLPASIAALRESGYDGYISLEFEGREDNLVGIEAGLRNLRRYIK